MSVTINAHQLGRLIDKTIGHMGSEYVEPLHGIRLDVDARYLYAVASDRHTIAVARYQLNHGDQQQEPWARTIPAGRLRSLREWIDSIKGAGLITISVADDRLTFEGPLTDLSIAVNTGMEFLDWRGLLRKHVEQAADGTTFPALDSGFLARFNTGDVLRVRLTGDEKPLLVFAEDFLGAQMPARYAGVYPAKEESFEGAHKSWLWTLAAGSPDATLDGAAFEEDRPRFEVTADIRETGEGLLREVLHSVTDGHLADYDTQRALWMAHIRIGVANWMAFRYLTALHNVDPRAAAAVVAEVAGELDSGEIGEFAWDAAEQAGFDPQQWHDEYEAHLKKSSEKAA
ncbi:hypothetical protein [Streptomyces cyaneogriseus]|uniref:hypothetical protein n=1 Tax=Streptomyces cyaneogriseus TaxID=68192 RepID=UPI000A8F4E49|nr:hypothetical protein [Streptomyces cyaneogriseus]